MSSVKNSVEANLEYLISQSVGHNCEMGFYPFELIDGALTALSHVFSFGDGVAVAALLKQGFAEHDAANMVRHRLVYAIPHFGCTPVEAGTDRDVVGGFEVGFYRLADGSIWSVHAGNDVSTYRTDDYVGEYLLVPTRGNRITNESVIERVRHMLTECDQFGRPVVLAA